MAYRWRTSQENHIAAAGSIAAAVSHARQIAGRALIEVEVENLDELRQALATDVDRIMLDNFDLDVMRRAVELTRSGGKRIELEASGNMNLETIRPVENRRRLHRSWAHESVSDRFAMPSRCNDCR